jgi:hypothetical protein
MFALGNIFRLLLPARSMLIAPPHRPLVSDIVLAPELSWGPITAPGAVLLPEGGVATLVRCGGDDDDNEEDLGDEEDLSTPDPDVDEESAFDDFDDEFDDDFEEEENDPDWDHPEDTESDEPPPAKGPGKKK